MFLNAGEACNDYIIYEGFVSVYFYGTSWKKVRRGFQSAEMSLHTF